MRLALISLALLALCSCDIGARRYTYQGHAIRVAILPLGDLDSAYAASAKQVLEEKYKCSVTVLEAVPLPQSAWYEPRKRYSAELLLQFLADTLKDFERVVGLTRKDIAINDNGKNWGVFGFGSMPGKSCVISSFRLKPQEKALHLQRFNKVVIHEFGHTLGLAHCEQSNTCYMQAAKGKIQTLDQESKELCPACHEKIASVLP